VSGGTAAAEWPYVRGGLVVVTALFAAALVGWAIQSVTYEDSGFAQLVKCLENEQGLLLQSPDDPIAHSARLGAVRTVAETNGVTVSVAANRREAERIVAAYHSVAGPLVGRLEQRGRLVYLWDRPASPTQRQKMFNCTY